MILPSFTEASPYVVDESLVRKRPVIIFEDIAYIVRGKIGVFVTKRNIESFSETVKYIMENYLEIVNSDTISEISAKAAFFLAYQYDYFWVKPDSALKYYKWLIKYHDRSDQAKESIKRIALLNAVLTDTLSN